MIELDIDTRDFARIAKALGAVEKQAERTLVSVLNRTAKKAQTKIRRELGQALSVPNKAVKQRMYLRKATKRRRSASIWVGLDPVGLHRVIRGNRKTFSHRGRSFPNAFRPRAGKAILQRVGKNRLPIELVTIDIEKQGRPVVEGRSFDAIQRELLKEFTRLLQVRLGKR